VLLAQPSYFEFLININQNQQNYYVINQSKSQSNLTSRGSFQYNDHAPTILTPLYNQ